MEYEVDNQLSIPTATGTVTDLIIPEYVYGRMESESGDPFYNLSVKFFDDQDCKIPSDTSEIPFSVEISLSRENPNFIKDWSKQLSKEIDAETFTFRCGIPHNAIPDLSPSREIYVRIKGWRTKNPTGLEKIESYVSCLGKISLNPTNSVRKISISWL